MTHAPFKRSGAILIVWLLLCSAGQWALVHHALEEQNQRSARIIEKAVGRMLEHAHRLNDDLTVQEAVQGLSQGPGVLSACVLDTEGKVLAHTEPSKLGQQFKFSPRHSSAKSFWRYSLQGQSASWGTFIFGISKIPLRQALAQCAWLLVSGGIGILCIAYWITRQCMREQQKQEMRFGHLVLHSKEQDKEIARLQQIQRDSKLLWTTWLQSGVEQISQPLLLLDETQRVLACNHAAQTHLGLASAAPIKGSSWQDLASLEGCGEALQRSLENPGQVIEASKNVRFLSESPSPEVGVGTWVFFSSDIIKE